MALLSPHGSPTASKGLECTWAGFMLNVKSLSYSRSASAEVDITCMDSSAQTDEKNSTRRLTVKSVDYGIIDPGEVQLEFLTGANGLTLSSLIGRKSELKFKTDEFEVASQAILTQFSMQMQVGEFITCNCTFKFTEL